MTADEILGQLQELFVDVFDLDDLVLTPAMTADDIEEWDSLSHIRLVVAIERHFGFRFATAEIEGLANVGDLVRAISDKVG